MTTLLTLALALIVCFLLALAVGLPLMLAWNSALAAMWPEIFPAITYWQAVSLYLLTALFARAVTELRS